MDDPARRCSEARCARRLFVFLLLVFALGSHGYLDNADAVVEYQTARALATRGSTALREGGRGSSAAEREIVAERFDVMQGEEGQWHSWFGLGHALTMLPPYVVGRGLAWVLPGVEERYLATWVAEVGEDRGAIYGDEFWSRLCVSLHSPLFGAGVGWILFLLLGRLGYAGRTRVLAVLIAALCTQFGPSTRESMSDTTAAFFLLAAVERALAWKLEDKPALLACGVLAGLALLCRVTHVVPLAALGLYVARHALGTRRVRELGPALCGFLPAVVVLLAFNALRFGSPFETGYSAGTSGGYWSFNFFWGLALIALSPGKGFLLFSPPCLVAFVGLRRAGRRRAAESWLALAVLVLPWVLNAFTTGWHSSEAWACRYATPGVVLCVGFGSAQLIEFGARNARRLLVGLAVAGFALNLGGWLTPYRGYYDLAFRTAAARWPEVPAGDRIHPLAESPRMSPLLVHWLYAAESLGGGLDAETAEEGSETHARLFGRPAMASARPVFADDRAFRHFWFVGLTHRLGSALPWLLALVAAVLLAVVGRGLRACLVDRASAREPDGR